MQWRERVGSGHVFHRWVHLLASPFSAPIIEQYNYTPSPNDSAAKKRAADALCYILYKVMPLKGRAITSEIPLADLFRGDVDNRDFGAFNARLLESRSTIRDGISAGYIDKYTFGDLAQRLSPHYAREEVSWRRDC